MMTKQRMKYNHSNKFFLETVKNKYSYNFNWLGLPIIQYPQDMVKIQELIWKIKPDLIIETGIAKGGSLILSASILQMLDLKYLRKKSLVIGVDILIKKKNRDIIKNHFLSKKIELIKGSSIDKKVIKIIKTKAKSFKKVIIFLDSNHSHDHVLEELRSYSDLVSKGSYLVVFDTVIEFLPKKRYNFFKKRNWHPGNSPMTAINCFLNENKNFKIDKKIDKQLVISAAKNGYLRKLS
jgi:cephalosporin hydroxylase